MENKEKAQIEEPAEEIADHAILQMELMDLKNHISLVIARLLTLTQKMENKALK